MEEQQPERTEENNIPTNSVTPAAYFVILKQATGDSGAKCSMVVAKQEIGGIGCHLEKISNLVPGGTGNQVKCHSGNVCINLDNQDMWSQFFKHGTEMVLTKHGRRMFPYCRFCILGLDPLRKYILVMDIAPVDNHRYKWNGHWWEINGKAEPHVLGRVYIHPNSPSSGSYWMRQPISFHKLKLTNNTLDQEGHVILHSMHRYLPRLHIIPADKLTDVIPLNGPNVHTFTFPQTEFVAVTAYQNIKITQLKIDFNPFAKGFRDDGLNSKPMREMRHQGGESMDADYSDDSASSNSILTESSEHLSFKAGERSEMETKHTRTCSSPDSSFDGELFHTDEDEDSLEGRNASKTNKLNAGMKVMKKRTTESILKCLPNIYSTNPSSVASSEYHEEPFKIIVKEEPPDDYEYNHVANPVILDCDGLKCKEEKEFLNSEGWDGGTNCDLQNETMNKSSINEVNATSSAVTKQPLISPIGVVKAKMLSGENTKVPVVYLEPCTFTNGTIKISELPQKLLSSCRRNGGPIPTAHQSPNSAKKPTHSSCSAENSQVENVDSKSVCSGPKESSTASEKNMNKTSTSTVSNNPPYTPPDKTSGGAVRLRKIKYTEKALNSGIWRTPSRIFCDSAENSPELPVCSKSAHLNTKAYSSGIWRPPGNRTDSIEETSTPRIESKSSGVSEQQVTVGACTRGRRKKLCLSAEHSQDALNSSLTSSEHLEREETFRNACPDLDDVEGVTFVSYASQDALQFHLVEHVSEDSSNAIHPTDLQESEEEKIERLEEQLLEDLSHLDPRVIMHPLLERAGLKPNSLMSTSSLNLTHLGLFISSSIVGPAQRDILEFSPIKQVQEPLEEEVSFVSRTGKTNDFTKLKGWKQKLGQHSGSSTSKQTETSTKPEDSLKNSSVFSSDKLDEYLENEEKIIEQRAALCENKTSKVVYQMPTKSSSYVRTLDSVLKSQADCRGSRTSNQTLVSPQPISVGSVSKNTKQIEMTLGPVSDSKEQKSANNAKVSSTPAKSTSLRTSFAPMRPAGLSKKQIKLMNLENGAVWVGKPRTYITEERAEASLGTLLTAQGSLSTKKHKVISRQVPFCKNEFCRLGCICSSLSNVKEPPKHCRKPECMLSCKCPKQKVLVLKSFANRKKQLTKSLREDLIFYDALADDEDWKPKAKKRKRKKVVEYAVPVSEQPVRSFPLWVREEGEVDPEPVYIAPHLESRRGNRSPTLSEVEDKGPVYWYFDSLMTCARVRVFERKDAEKSVTCTCSSTSCCRQENSKGNNGKVATCKLNTCRNSTTIEVMDSEKSDDFDSNSMSPNAAQTSEWKQKEKAYSPLHCDSPHESTSLQLETPQSSVETKNTPKLIEIISDCNWESERSNILGVLAQYTANKRPLEKMKIGDFLVEIVSNYGKGRDPSPGNVLISNSVVKISQSSEKEGNGKNSGCNTVPTTSQSPGIQLTETQPIAPKEKLPTPTKCTVQEKEVTTFHLGSIVAGKQKPAFDTPTSTSRKSGMIQFTGNANGDTKLTLGQVGALHPVNWVIANLKKKIKIVEPFKTSSSSTVASEHLTTCSTSSGNEVLRDTNPTSVNQAKENLTAPDVHTHLVINKVGGFWKKKSSFSTLEPVRSRQQLETPISTLSTIVSAGVSKHPETSNSTPPDLSKATKPPLLLIPVQSTPTARPAQNLQLQPVQKMILQPLRCPGGKLFQHPNGQIVQLLPISNSGPVSRPNLHQMVTLAVRNPGSGSGNCLQTPIKSCLVASSPSNVTLCPKGIMPQRGRPRSTTVIKPACVALKQTSIQPSPTISAVVSKLPVKTTSQAKFVTLNGIGQTINARHLVPLQPVGFALLQLPRGQKSVSNAIITTGKPLKLANQSSASQSFEQAGSEKTANQNNKSEEKLIEPGLEMNYVANSELIETTLSEGVPDEDHVNADPLPDAKQETDAFLSTPSVSEMDDELEDDSMDHQNALEHPTPAELVDHSYTSEKQIVEEENENSVLENSTRTGKGSAFGKDSSRSKVDDKEPEEMPRMEEKNCLQDEQMEVEMEDTKCWFEASTFNVPLKREEDMLKYPENEELDFHQGLMEYENFLDSDKDTDSQSDLEDGDSQSDAEDIDLERTFNSTPNEEAVDIETVEELSEKINMARLIASASRLTSKSKCHVHNPHRTNDEDDDDEEEEDIKSKPKHIAHLSKETKAQLDALVEYRSAHTVSERRRRSELRGLFEKLKRTLDIHGEEKTSKYFILKQAFAEIQNLQDYSDCLSAGKSIQTRRRDFLIRKVSLLTGKTEEVILKKLEYICAKQRALDDEKRKFMEDGDDASELHSVNWSAASFSTMDSLQKVAMDLQIQKPPNVTMLCSGQDVMSQANCAKPLILARKHSTPRHILPAIVPSISSIPLAAGSLLMTQQGQVLTLKGALISGQTPSFTAEGLISGNQPKGDGVTGTSIAGIASVTIQLQGLPVPLQVNNFTIAGSLSPTLTTSSQLSTRPDMEAISFGLADACQGNDAGFITAAVDDDVSSFMMPRIVNVTSLATGEASLLNLEEANDSCALVPQPLDFSMKRRKHASQEQLSPMTSKKPNLSTIKSNSQSSGQFTAPDESEVMSFLVSSEATESKCAQQQTRQTAASPSMNDDKNAELPKALDLSGLPDGTAMSCARHSTNQDLVPQESTSVTEILGDKLELEVMSGRMQACNMDKAGGQTDRDAELSASQLLEPLLKTNSSANDDMVDTEGYEPFTSLLNELAFLNQHFSDEESPDNSMSDNHTLSFINSGNQGDSMDELSLIHGPVRLVDIDAVDSATVLKQVAGRESDGSTSPLLLQLEGEDLNVEQLLGDEIPVDSQSELDNCRLDFEGNSLSGPNNLVNVSPPPLIHMKIPSSSTNTEIPSSLDLLWRPMPKLAPLGLVRGSGKGESSEQTESESENSPESSKPMPALARIPSPQQTSTEGGPEVASEEH